MNAADERAFTTFEVLPDSALVRVNVVAALYGISVRTVWRWVKDGQLPAPDRRFSVTGWKVGDIRRHIRAGNKPEA